MPIFPQRDYADMLEDERERDMDATDYIETFGITPEEAAHNAAEAKGDRQREEEP